jgi:ferredoxin
MPKVNFVNEKREIDVPEGCNLREAALQAGIQVNFFPGPCMETLSRYVNCRGHGTCASCLVVISKGVDNLTPKSGWEKFQLGTMLSTIGHEDDARLACQTQVKGDVSVVTNPGLNWDGENFWQKPYPNK